MKSYTEIYTEVRKEYPDMTIEEAIAEADRRVVKSGGETKVDKKPNGSKNGGRVQRKTGKVHEGDRTD